MGFIVADVSYLQHLMIWLLWNMRVKYSFFITSGYLEEVFQCVYVTNQDLVHKCNLEILRFNIDLEDFMFELYFSDKFLCVVIQCCNLVACELLHRWFSLLQNLKLSVDAYHKQHIVEFLYKLKSFLNNFILAVKKVIPLKEWQVKLFYYLRFKCLAIHYLLIR